MSSLRWSTAGESHGKALIGMLEGLPSGLPFSVERVDAELARRQRGYGRGGRMAIETDRIEVLSGTKGGLTLGSPLALSLVNRDYKIEELPIPPNARPGHADLAGCQQHGHRDPRAVLERASARETAMRVALGGAARQLLEHFGVRLFGHVVELGGRACGPEAPLEAPTPELEASRDASPFHCLRTDLEEALKADVDAAAEARDTLGGVFEVQVHGLPPGLGSYMSGPQRLTSRLAGALMAIPAMKGVEFGLGFEAARRPGSQVHDAIRLGGAGAGRFDRASNRAGGLEGGLTTGQPLVARVAMKPIATLRQGVETVDFESGESVRSTYQRSDVTAVPAASVVGEAVVALELASAWREKFGGDGLAEVERNVRGYLEGLEGV